MEYSVKIYSRIGELMQGVLPDASAFLVSGLPSRRWFSEAVLRRGAAAGEPGRDLPPKAREALAMLERQVGLRLPKDVRIGLRSNIPWGKGLSSSSTDVLSVLSVADAFWETGLSAEALYRLAARVEPTDPCLSGDILVFYQHTGNRGVTIELPPVTLLYFDAAPEARVDTLQLSRRWQEGAGTFFSRWLHRLIIGAAEKDYAQVFDAVTCSAEYNQQLLPLPGFAELHKLAEEKGAGVMVAHSGTIAGLLTKPEEAADLLPRVEALVQRIAGGAASPVYVEHYHSPYHRSLCPAFPAH